MPYGNGTGPWWAQGRWRCRRPGFGRGYGTGYGPGYGRGMGRAAYSEQPQSRESDTSDLEAYANELESELNEVKKRIKEKNK